MRAVLLAGGKGTRLYPFTAALPKPLVPLGDKPILEILIRRLKQAGFDHVTLCVGHLAALIEAYFKDGKDWGINIDYSYESTPLGTVGPVKKIKDLPEEFLVANGDLLTDADFLEMLNSHKKARSCLTVGVYKREEKIDLGVLEIKEDRVVDYIEKPTKEYFVSAGVYIFSKKALDYVPENSYFDFPPLVKGLINEGQPVGSFKIKGFWLDIGRPDDYQKAVEHFTSNTNIFLKE